jgi:hypothetical protein
LGTSASRPARPVEFQSSDALSSSNSLISVVGAAAFENAGYQVALKRAVTKNAQIITDNFLLVHGIHKHPKSDN